MEGAGDGGNALRCASALTGDSDIHSDPGSGSGSPTVLAQGRMNDKTGEDSDPESNPWSDSGTAAMLAQSLAIDDGVQARGTAAYYPM